MDVRAGLIARVDNLRTGGKGLMFDVLQSTPAEFLFGSPCILELKYLVNDDEKAFLMGLLLIRLYEAAEADLSRRDGNLHHLTLIEEAHRLLRNTSTEQTADVANPRGRAIEVFANILSEVRAYGEGFLIAEQVPSKLTTDAVKNTSLKIVHKLLAEDDRQLMGKAMNLDERQIRGLGLLAPGEAVVSTERMFKPVLVNIPFAKGDLAPISQQALVVAVKPFQLEGLAACRYCAHANRICRPDRKTQRIDLQNAFRKLVNLLRFGPSGAFAQYQQLVHLHAANPKLVSAPFDCMLAHLAERECELRGTFYSWKFTAVEQLMNLLLDEIDLLAAAKPPLGSFQQAITDLQKISPMPFAGCTQCGAPCAYRFDVSTAEGSREFKERFHQFPLSWNSLAGICWSAAASIPPDVVRARQEAALCFGIQQLHALRISLHDQQTAAEYLARSLSLEVNNRNGQKSARTAG